MNSSIKIEKVRNKNLSNSQKKVINNARVKEWGNKTRKDFSKDYEPQTIWYFVKSKNKIVSLGGIRPIKISYQNKKYSIGGICSTISLVKGKGYGKIMIEHMIKYAKKINKTILGFTTQTPFFKKSGLDTKKDFIKQFVWIKPNGEKVYDDEGDGIYYEGKDKIISKILKSKDYAVIYVEHW